MFIKWTLDWMKISLGTLGIYLMLDLKPRTLGETRDPKPETLSSGEMQDLRPDSLWPWLGSDTQNFKWSLKWDWGKSEILKELFISSCYHFVLTLTTFWVKTVSLCHCPSKILLHIFKNICHLINFLWIVSMNSSNKNKPLKSFPIFAGFDIDWLDKILLHIWPFKN